MGAMIFDKHTLETRKWTVEDLLAEINRDHSDDYTPYDETDWLDGWNEWCEGEFYSLVEVLK